MVVFNDDKGETIVLETGASITINPTVWHIHTNPYDKVSITYWDFDGDIREIIENINKTANE